MPIGFAAVLLAMLVAGCAQNPAEWKSASASEAASHPPPGRMIYTADMVPIGTPIHVVISSVATEAKHNGIPLMFQVTDDVVVGGRTVVSKGDAGFANAVSGGWVVSGVKCRPTVGLETVTVLQFVNGTPAFPGVTLANHHQLVPVSFANPSVAGAPNLLEVRMGRGCVAGDIRATVYITGPPVMPESLLPARP